MTSHYNSNRNRQRAKYICADILSAWCVWLLFLLFRWMVYDGRVFGYDEILIPAFNFYTPLILYPLGCLVIHYLSGFYMRPYRRTPTNDIVTTGMASAIIALIAFFIIVLDDEVTSYYRYYYSLLVLFVLQFVLSYVFRLGITLNTRRAIRRGQIVYNTVIIGTGVQALRIAHDFLHNKDGKRVIGFITPTTDVSSHTNIQPILGNINDMPILKQQYNINTAIVAIDSDNDNNTELYKIIEQLYPLNIEIQFVPRINEILTGKIRINNLSDPTLMSITDHTMSDCELSIKRAFDIIVSLIALVITSPLWLLCAICIKCTSPGPILYKQERIGLHGRTFRIIKFRTMYINSEKYDVPQLSSPHDKRTTSVGYWLRKYRLDEIPQFWNILKGEMSIVGPRPERKFYIDKIMQRAPYYCLIYRIRPGLTSWGPIKVGYTDTLDKMIDRLNYDIIYLDNMSLKIDLKILFFTIGVIINGKGQ
ncbi:MAG: sugar transferase [Paludibacteraceae bacterium]